MSGPIRSHRWPRGVLCGLTLVLATAAMSTAEAAGHYQLQASLTPASAPGAAKDMSRGIAHELHARLSTPTQAPLVQLGSQHALTAKLVVSPMVCYGDTIFRDGFQT